MNKAKVAATTAKARKANGRLLRNRNGANNTRDTEKNGQPDGARNGVNETVRAVRAVRATRRELEAAMQRYTDLYELAPIPYVTFDRAGRIEQVNRATCELLGSTRTFLEGVPFSLVVAPKDLQVFLRHLVRCRSGEKRVESNLHLKKRGEENVPVFISTIPTSDVLHDGSYTYQTAIIDLTQHERAEKVFREKEAELERIITQTPFMLTRCTRDLHYRYVSHAYAKMLGFTPERLAGKPIVDVIGKEGLKAIRPYIEKVLTGTEVEYEQDVPFTGIGNRFLHTVYIPDRDESGNVIGWMASIADLTERRKTEAAALRLASVVRSSHDAIVAKTLKGIITDWNESAERIFGYTAKEIIGQSILTLIPKDRHDEETEILRKIRRGDSIDHYQTVRRRKDGKLIDVSLTISPVKDADGKIVGVSKIARDITKQRRVERQLAEQARLLDLSNEAILVRDAEDRIAYWNHGAAELYGYSADEALGKVTHELLRTEHPEPLEQIFKKLGSDGRWSGEMVHRRKNGSKIVVMSHWALDRDRIHGRSFVLETNTDITVRKQTEMELQRSKEMLEELVLQRTRALRGANAELENEIRRRKGLEGQILEISDREQEKLGQELHDGLCQQLTAIGFLARATALRLKDHRVVQHEDLERIAQLINSSVMDARNIARDLHKEEIDAAEFDSALEDLVDRKIWKTPCRLELKTEINIENDVVASQLYRVLREAILNANKHARATEIVLEVKRDKRNLIFRVSDNGVGFNSRSKGHGLGFHIMKYRTESIGARLELESSKKGGARVTCYVPLAVTK